MRNTNEILSARMKAVKRVMCTRRSVFYMPEGFSSSLLWWELEKAGYPLRKNDKNATRKLEQDYNRHCELNSTWEERLSCIFWNGVRIIFSQPANQRKNLAVAWLTVVRIGLGNESPNVMASVRAREAFQQNAFPGFKLMDRKEQNPKLTRLEKLHLGDFHKGDAAKGFKDAGIFKLQLIDEEPTDVDSLFASLRSLLDLGTGSLFVGGSHVEIFLLVMTELDAGFKGFLGYTIAQKEVNAAAKEVFKAENPLPPKPEKPKKVYKARKYNMSKAERKAVEEGRAALEDNKVVWTVEVPEPVAFTPESLLDVSTDLEQHRVWLAEISAQKDAERVAYWDELLSVL